MKHRGKTPSFRGIDGAVLPGSIAEISYLPLGGFDQWIMIRGENIANPVLILLHGGPGFPEMRLFRHFNAPLEKLFTLVFWEQRGTDKSFDRNIPPASMTVEQFLSDLDELVDTVRLRLGKDRVAIYGHSWGSVLGPLYCARHPQKVSAYIGTGQIGDWPASEAACIAFTLAEAERRGNSRALKQLRALGAPPHSVQAMMVQRKWFSRFIGVARGVSLWKFLKITLGRPESSIIDLPNILRGIGFSTRTMWSEVSALNLNDIVPELQIPVFFFLGRHDRVVAPEFGAAYFENLKAPSKQLVWFENSTHEPPIEEPEKFHAMMSELVRPAALGAIGP